MILTSLCCASEGSHNVLGIPVRFENGGDTSWCAKIFSIITGYDHTLAHEMGHAFTATWLLPRSNPRITIYPAECMIRSRVLTFDLIPPGVTNRERDSGSPTWKKTIVYMAGAVSSVAYSFCKLIVAIALQNIFWPATLVLGGISIYRITMELVGALRGILNADHPGFQNNDFAQIARNGGCAHLACALSVLVIEVALGVLLVNAFVGF